MQQPRATAFAKLTLPPLDLEQPGSIRTATFAMG